MKDLVGLLAILSIVALVVFYLKESYYIKSSREDFGHIPLPKSVKSSPCEKISSYSSGSTETTPQKKPEDKNDEFTVTGYNAYGASSAMGPLGLGRHKKNHFGEGNS